MFICGNGWVGDGNGCSIMEMVAFLKKMVALVMKIVFSTKELFAFIVEWLLISSRSYIMMVIVYIKFDFKSFLEFFQIPYFSQRIVNESIVLLR